MKIAQAKVNFKELTKEEKKNYIHGLIELKSKQKEEKLKRIEDLKLSGKKLFLLKIKNESMNSTNLNFILSYNDDEIEMAKKCLLNKWDFPPPSFFERIKKNSQFLDLYNDNPNSPNKANSTNSSWNKETYLQLIVNEQYDKEVNSLKKFNGAWLEYDEFKILFKKFIVLHNPKTYKTQQKYDNNWYNFTNDVYEPNPDFQVFYFSSIPNLNNEFLNNNNKFSKKNSCVLIVFEPNIDKNLLLNDINFYIIIDIIDLNGSLIIENVTLTSFFFSLQIDCLSPNKEYFLIIKSTLCPFGYHLSLYSDHSIENYSYNNYLKKFKNYTSYPFKIEHNSMEKNKYFVLMRASIKVTKKTMLNYHIKYNDRYVKQCIDIVLIHKENKIRMFPNEYLNLEASEQFYIILMQLVPPFNCPENSLEIEFFSDNSSINFEIIQHLETYEVFDRYVPNKHGIIFKELIYVIYFF